MGLRMGRWVSIVALLVTLAGAGEPVASSRRVSYDADGLPAKQVIADLSQRLNRAINVGWNEDPWLKQPLTLHLDKACPRDVVAELCRVSERTMQRSGAWSMWLQQRYQPERWIDQRVVGDWQVRLRQVSFSYRADLRPGGAEPAKIDRNLTIDWLLLPPDDLSTMALLDAQPQPLKYSDGTVVPVADQRLWVSPSEGYLQLSLRLPEPPAGDTLSIAELGLSLTIAPVTERQVQLDLPTGDQPSAPVEVDGWQYTLQRRASQRLVVTARPIAGRGDPAERPAQPDEGRSSPVARAMAEQRRARQRAAEGRLLGPAGEPLLTATNSEPISGRQESPQAMRLTIWPLDQDRERDRAPAPEPTRLLLWSLDLGQPGPAEELRWQNLPLPPRTLGETP